MDPTCPSSTMVRAAPGIVAECEIDLHPGGMFRFVLEQPDGTRNSITCCYLEVVPCRRLVWTAAPLPGYRPASSAFFTAVMTLGPRLQHAVLKTSCRRPSRRR